MNITIRKARPDDAGKLTDLIMRSKSSNGYDEAFMAACREELAVTGARLAEEEYWVAETDVLCGCACLLVDENDTSGEVSAFFVDPGWQGKGVGRLLWQKLLERAKAQALSQLHLDSDPFAVPFYQAMGFAVTGQTPSGSIPGRFLPYMTLSL